MRSALTGHDIVSYTTQASGRFITRHHCKARIRVFVQAHNQSILQGADCKILQFAIFQGSPLSGLKSQPVARPDTPILAIIEVPPIQASCNPLGNLNQTQNSITTHSNLPRHHRPVHAPPLLQHFDLPIPRNPHHPPILPWKEDKNPSHVRHKPATSRPLLHYRRCRFRNHRLLH
jgi:hypothetical protein